MWDNRYRMLRRGEIIQEGDEVDVGEGWRGRPVWIPTTLAGQAAPDPYYLAHRRYRRLEYNDMNGDKDMSEPVLYILMRSDLPSLNPGKAMAQAAHAASMLAEYFFTTPDPKYQLWVRQGGGFGTTIVLDGQNEEVIRASVDAWDHFSHAVGLVIDPEYPIRDGKNTLHAKDVLTCGWVFGIPEEINDVAIPHPVGPRWGYDHDFAKVLYLNNFRLHK